MKLFNHSPNQPTEIEFDAKNVVRLAPREEKEVDDKFKDHPVLKRFPDVQAFVEEKPVIKKGKDEKKD